MDLPASLHITQKGVDEIKHRVHKLSIRKRSVLILLESPQPVEYVLRKTVLGKEEIVETIESLLHEGFIAASDNTIQTPNTLSHAATSTPASEGSIHLDDEIILSEAKFVLTDFSVDSFGTQSQSFVDQIRACKTVNDLRLRLNEIFSEARKQCPDRLPVLLKLVEDINETA